MLESHDYEGQVTTGVRGVGDALAVRRKRHSLSQSRPEKRLDPIIEGCRAQDAGSADKRGKETLAARPHGGNIRIATGGGANGNPIYKENLDAVTARVGRERANAGRPRRVRGRV